MIKLVENKKEELQQICKHHQVSKLYLFGSAAKGNFDPVKSDLDMVVEFSSSVAPVDYALNYFSFLEALEDLFNKKVELISFKALKNAVMIQEIEKSKIQLYAA
ncbi:hypothetical protein BH23BAC1_BH23BAC1_16460 [soil metagenome]